MTSTPKVSKKRKMGLLDSPQASFDRLTKVDLMQIERPNAHLDSFYKQILTPAVTIASANPPRPIEISVVEFNKCWEVQKALVSDIFSNQTKKGINYITSARFTESLCRFGKAETLYAALINEIQLHVQYLKSVIMKPDNNLLISLRNSWETFGSQLTIIKNVFMELDRSFILPKTKYSSVIQLGKHIFSEVILDTDGFCESVVDEILELIRLDRNGKEIDKQLIKSILNMMLEFSYYTKYFEPKFLKASIEYYRAESFHLIHSASIPEYIEHADKRRNEELDERIPAYLDIRTKLELDKAVTHELIYSKADMIIKQGFSEMMDHTLINPLRIIYSLLTSSSSQIDILRQAYGEYIKTTGVSLIKDPQNDSTMISSVLKLKKKLDRVLKECFNENDQFGNVLKESCEYFMNTRGNKPAELLAKVFDARLKISNKRRNEGNSDLAVLDRALALFRFLQCKDAFEAYYKRFLAKRLLLNKSVSRSMENHVLDKLRLECGYEFTKNLDSMFNDMGISGELHTGFKEYKKETPRMPINVRVIAQATWPPYPVTEMCLPNQMVGTQKLYEDFYASRFNGRKLLWQNSLSSCIITGHFTSGQKEISCSLTQAIIILLFNNRETLLFSEIQNVTNLATKDLIALLSSLSSKPNALIVNESGKVITEQDRFGLNPDFESQSNKVKLPPALVDQITEEQKDAEKSVKANRQYQLEAAIMRIMKAKRKLHHNDLMNELFAELKYPLEANDLKKRIDMLIERDYLARCKSDRSLYIYLS